MALFNSIGLYHDGRRWWSVHLLWHAGSDQHRLPERYLERR